jgi:hypothetical protein
MRASSPLADKFGNINPGPSPGPDETKTLLETL